ncbi:hypothetical protein JJ665_27730 (plasmid) [Klebsiella pneumoniae]|nr:hypothetical protein JJ665_27730 [Klebsiella pneumoniae]
MTKSTITRERLSDILEFGSGRLIKPISDEEIELMARMALAAMDNACRVSMTKTPAGKSEFLLYAEKLAADTKALAERVKRNDVTALTTSEEHRQLRDLVMMVKMLCRTIRKYNPESQQAADYTAYLQKEGLISAADCLRGSDPKETDTEDRRG